MTDPTNPYGYMPEMPDMSDLDPKDREDIHAVCALYGCLGWAVTIIVAVIVCLLTGSCTTTEYVTVPEVREHWHHQTDTIRQTDSVTNIQTTIVREVDSAVMARYGIQLQAAQRAWLVETDRLQRELSALREVTHDTVVERDSVPYPVEVIKQVPRERSRTEWLFLAAGMAALVYVITRVAKWLRRFLPDGE